MTEAVKRVAEETRAYWLLDLIVLAQASRQDVAAEQVQVWTLTVHDEERPAPWSKSALLSCEDRRGRTLYSRSIEYTDFPLPELKLYFRDATIRLPGE